MVCLAAGDDLIRSLDNLLREDNARRTLNAGDNANGALRGLDEYYDCNVAGLGGLRVTALRY